MIPLASQRVVVTGAAQGLGAAIARAFAAAGADLVLMDREAHGLAAVQKETGGLALVVDLADADAISAVTGKALEAGPVDTLIHNAAILNPQPLMDVSQKMFRATIDVGIQAGFLLSQAVWPGMQAGGGALIFVSSQSGIKGFADETAYCAAKHALEGFSKCLALEAPEGVISCTITPGHAMQTPMSERNYPPALKAEWVAPDRLAPAFLHIAETRDPMFNGQRLNAWEIAQSLEGPP